MITTSLETMLSQITLLTRENKRLDEEKELNQEQSKALTYQMISMIGGANMCMQMVKMQLTSSNETLENEIVALKNQHIKEVKSLYDDVNLKISLTAAKVKAIVEEFELYLIGDLAQANNVAIKDLELLRALVVNITKCQDTLFSYPEYEDLREKSLIPYQKQMVNFPVIENFALIKNDSAFQAHMEKEHLTYKALKQDVEPLEAMCQSLITKKEIMIDFHKKHLEKIEFKKNEGLNSPLKKAYDLINSVFNQIDWSKLLTVKPGLYPENRHPNPTIRALYYKKHQDYLDNVTNTNKEKMGLIVISLSSIVNQENSKEGTKS